MMKRPVPAVATWLLEHFAPRYQRDSLVGDLIEQYQRGRSRLWYWKQVVAALFVASGKLLRPTLAVSAIALLLRLTAESIAVTGLVSLFCEWRSVATPAAFARTALITTVVALTLIVSLGLRAANTGDTRKRRQPAIKRLLAAFAAITLSVATLTWAHTSAAGPLTRPNPSSCVERR